MRFFSLASLFLACAFFTTPSFATGEPSKTIKTEVGNLMSKTFDAVLWYHMYRTQNNYERVSEYFDKLIKLAQQNNSTGFYTSSIALWEAESSALQSLNDSGKAIRNHVITSKGTDGKRALNLYEDFLQDALSRESVDRLGRWVKIFTDSFLESSIPVTEAHYRQVTNGVRFYIVCLSIRGGNINVQKIAFYNKLLDVTLPEAYKSKAKR